MHMPEVVMLCRQFVTCYYHLLCVSCREHGVWYLPHSVTKLFVLQESDYFTDRGEFRVDAEGTPTLLNSLMYKLSYYKFGDFKVSLILQGVIRDGMLLQVSNWASCYSWTTGVLQGLTAPATS